MSYKFHQNVRNPKGLGGRRMVKRMNEHHAKLAAWGMSQLEFNEEDVILDVGCGGGANIAILLDKCPKGKVYGLDYSEVSVNKSRKVNKQQIKNGRCNITQGNVENMPFDDNAFDMVTAFETIYFWSDIKKAFAEVRRIVKPGGRFFVCCEDTDPVNDKWVDIIEGMKVYTKEQIRDLMSAAGFNDISMYRDDENEWECVIGK